MWLKKREIYNVPSALIRSITNDHARSKMNLYYIFIFYHGGYLFSSKRSHFRAGGRFNQSVTGYNTVPVYKIYFAMVLNLILPMKKV